MAWLETLKNAMRRRRTGAMLRTLAEATEYNEGETGLGGNNEREKMENRNMAGSVDFYSINWHDGFFPGK